MVTIESVAPKGVVGSESTAAVVANGASEPPQSPRRPGYPGCRHFNENYIGSWLVDSPLWADAAKSRH